MSDDTVSATVFNIFVICAMVLGIIFGAAITKSTMGPELNKIKGEAVERGYAHWVPDPKSGQPTWSWNDGTKKP